MLRNTNEESREHHGPGAHVVDQVLVEEALGAVQDVRLEALHVHLDQRHVLADHRVHPLARHAQPLVRALVVDGPARKFCRG